MTFQLEKEKRKRKRKHSHNILYTYSYINKGQYIRTITFILTAVNKHIKKKKEGEIILIRSESIDGDLHAGLTVAGEVADEIALSFG